MDSPGGCPDPPSLAAFRRCSSTIRSIPPTQEWGAATWAPDAHHRVERADQRTRRSSTAGRSSKATRPRSRWRTTVACLERHGRWRQVSRTVRCDGWDPPLRRVRGHDLGSRASARRRRPVVRRGGGRARRVRTAEHHRGDPRGREQRPSAVVGAPSCGRHRAGIGRSAHRVRSGPCAARRRLRRLRARRGRRRPHRGTAHRLRAGHLALVALDGGAFTSLVVDSIDAYRFDVQTSRFETFEQHIATFGGELLAWTPTPGVATDSVAGLLASTGPTIATAMAPGRTARPAERVFDQWVAALAVPIGKGADTPQPAARHAHRQRSHR